MTAMMMTMSDYSKIKKPERAEAVDRLAQQWADPKLIAGTLAISSNVAHRYLKHLGYRRVYITADESELVAGYRASKKAQTR